MFLERLFRKPLKNINLLEPTPIDNKFVFAVAVVDKPRRADDRITRGVRFQQLPPLDVRQKIPSANERATSRFDVQDKPYVQRHRFKKLSPL
jgi:hypothetical protein